MDVVLEKPGCAYDAKVGYTVDLPYVKGDAVMFYPKGPDGAGNVLRATVLGRRKSLYKIQDRWGRVWTCGQRCIKGRIPVVRTLTYKGQDHTSDPMGLARDINDEFESKKPGKFIPDFFRKMERNLIQCGMNKSDAWMYAEMFGRWHASDTRAFSA